MTIQVRVVDKGYNALRRRLEDSDGVQVVAGLLDPEQAKKGVFNEFGTEDAPARPWLSRAADSNEMPLVQAQLSAIASIADGSKPAEAMGQLGETVAGFARDVIETQNIGGPELAESTKLRKGHDTKLIDSGDMLEAITSEVRNS